MSLEGLLSQLRIRSQEAVEDVLAEAEESARRIKDEAGEKSKAAIKKQAESLTAQLTRAHSGQIAAAELSARQDLAAIKAKLLADLRRETYAGLCAMDEAERRGILAELMVQVRHEMPQGALLINPRDRAALGDVEGFQVETSDSLDGGLIAESSDRSVRLDLSFRALLDETWQKENANVARMLFEGGGAA